MIICTIFRCMDFLEIQSITVKMVMSQSYEVCFHVTTNKPVSKKQSFKMQRIFFKSNDSANFQLTHFMTILFLPINNHFYFRFKVPMTD